MSSSHYRVTSVARTYPKIAVVCGAHTDVGQLLLRELLQSSEIEKVHAIAFRRRDVDLNRMSKSALMKVRLYTSDPRDMMSELEKITDADIGFCCLGTERHAYGTIGLPMFRMLNLDAPIRFMKHMFTLGVLYVGVLSHENADVSSRSELYKLRGELENVARELRWEAANFSPYVTIFKTGTLNLETEVRVRGREMSGELRDVVRAMKIDALEKTAKRRRTGVETESKYEEMDRAEIGDSLREARIVARDHYERRAPFWED